MIQIIYSSATEFPWSQRDLDGLLRRSRIRNQERGITGMLVYEDCMFLQLIEGEEEAVYALFRAIARDPVHKGILALDDGPIVERTFPAWSMGFHRYGADAVPEAWRELETHRPMGGPLPSQRLAAYQLLEGLRERTWAPPLSQPPAITIN